MRRSKLLFIFLFLTTCFSLVELSGEDQQDERVMAACSYLLKQQYKKAEELLRNPKTTQEKGLYALLIDKDSTRDRSFGIKTFDVNKANKLAKECLPHLQKEAKENPLSARILGSFYYDGIGVKKEISKAFQYYLQAAEANEPMAMNNVGYFYLNGVVVNKNTQKGIWWTERAAAAGNTVAMCTLASLYKKGNVVKENSRKAQSFYVRAANTGNSLAMYILAMDALTEAKELNDEREPTRERQIKPSRSRTRNRRDRTDERRKRTRTRPSKTDQLRGRAKTWLEKSAKAGFTPAMRFIALGYENGYLYPEDEAKALKWYEKAAQSGLAEALFDLARCYDKGVGTSRNLNVANIYYEEAHQAAQKQGDDDVLNKTIARKNAQLKLLDWHLRRESGFIMAEGQVQNISNNRLQNVTAVVLFKTQSGGLVTSNTALIEYNPIMPGQVSPFKVIETDNPQISNVSMDFKFLLGGTIPWYSAQ
jgi:TPR repeat protein